MSEEFFQSMRIFAYYHGQGLVCELDKAMLFTYILQEKDIVDLIINHIKFPQL